MTKRTFTGALLASSMLTGAAFAEDVTLTIESWRNDDLAIWQDKSSRPLRLKILASRSNSRLRPLPNTTPC